MKDARMLWRRLDTPGHEACCCRWRDAAWHLSGAAVFVYGGEPCRLDFAVKCDADWQTLSAGVRGWVGEKEIAVGVSRDGPRRWRLNGADVPSVAGCSDIDLNFSPSTNLLPIRRLDLAVGQEAAVKAAWLRFPGFTLEPLEQLYRRLDAETYRYQSAGGRFTTDLTVNAAGFVTCYPDYFKREA